MAVVNVTPDSFYAASRTPQRELIVERVRNAIEEGAAIIDIGGYSSRPGAGDVPLQEELRRVLTGIECVRELSKSIPISVDTFRAEVAAKAVEVDDRIIINDISAGELDSDMVKVVAESGVPYIAMSMRGTPATMASMCRYSDVVSEVADYLRRRSEYLMEQGVSRENILLDPGFGFAKSVDQNYELLGGLDKLFALGFPLAAGISRKSMIYKTLGTGPEESLFGTTALHWELLRCGVTLLRVHDTRAAVDTIRIFNKFKSLNDK